MANLRANRITSTEVFETTGSVQFDGTDDRLTFSSSSDFAFGTGDFTIEFWFYSNDILSTTQRGFFQTSDTAGGLKTSYASGIAIYHGADYLGGKTGGLVANILGTTVGSIGPVISLATWNHCALTRQSGIVRLFLNGALINTASITGSIDGTNLAVGGYYNTSYLFNGFLSNFRILKGTALYTANFTPPTRELEVIPNTVLLACQSTTKADEEKTGKTITVNGNAVANELTPGLLTNVVKSGGSSAITGSVEFDGTGDYLSLADTTDFDIGLNKEPFTWEVWFNMTSPTTITNNLGLNRGGGTAGWNSTDGHQYQAFHYTDNKLYWQFWNGSSNVSVTSNANEVSVGSWNHFAITYDGTTTRGFLNGIQFPTTSTSNYAKPSSSNISRIGTEASGSNFGSKFQSNIRIIKGTALYTQNFIPPTSKLINLPGTVLLCCQDSNDPTTEATGKTITGYGDLQKADGVELVTNGTFDTDTTGWTDIGTDWSVSGGQVSTSGEDVYLDQQLTTVIGKVYKVTFDITTNYSNPQNGIYIRYGNGSGYTDERIDNKTGTFTHIFTAVQTNHIIRLYNGGTSTITFDNVSVTLYDPPNRASDFTPSVGSDGSVEFAGPITINTENYFYLPTGPTEQRALINNNYGARGILGGGYNGSVWLNSLQYVTIGTTGNALDFGDLSSGRPYVDAVSSSTRGVFGGGEGNNTIDYITISSTGNAADFGDSTSARRDYAGCSNSTRGLFGGGQGTNIIEYITIASIGNAVDFGDLTQGRYFLGACSSPTRGVFAGGDTGAPAAIKNINYVTIASTGNAQTFGDLTISRSTLRGCSNSIRGVFSGGYTIPGSSNTIDYITIASTGTATDFGDMTTARGINSALSSSLRGLFTNWTPSTGVSAIDYINITSTSNALDFGDTITQAQGGCSSGHGGLG